MKTKKIVLLLLLLIQFTLFAQVFNRVETFGGSSDDEIYAVAIDSQGNVYTTGIFHDTVDFDSGAGVTQLTSAGTEDIFIKKTDANGQLLWVKQIGGANSDGAIILKIDANDNLYLSGWFSNSVDFDPGANTYNLTSNGLWDTFVLKLDSNGDFIWAKSYGNTSLDLVSDFELDNYGNIYLTGTFKNTVDFDPSSNVYNLISNGAWDAYVLKLDNNGDFVWAQNFGSSSYDKGRSVTIDDMGNIYLTGQFKQTVDFNFGPNINELTAVANYDGFILKLTGDGSFIWVKQLGGDDTTDPLSIAVDNQQNIFISGKFKGTVDFDPGQGSNNITADDQYDMFILKLNDTGNLNWVHTLSGPEDIFGTNISTVNDKIYSSGFFEGNALLSWSNGFLNFTSAGEKDGIFVIMNQNGDVINTKQIGGTGNDVAYKVKVNNQKIYIIGSFENNVNIDAGTNTSITSNGEKDAFLLVLDENNNGMDTGLITKINIYPNPAQDGRFTIDTGDLSGVDIRILDMSGRIIYTRNNVKGVFPLQLDLKQGIYLIECRREHQKTVFKLNEIH